MYQKNTITTIPQQLFTEADVQAYLDTLGDEEEVGLTCSGSNCLLARAASRRFPIYYVLVHTGRLCLTLPKVTGDELPEQNIPLSPVLVFLYQQFDSLGGSGFDGMDRAITKGEWLAHWRSLIATSPFLQQYYGPDGRLHLAPPHEEEDR